MRVKTISRDPELYERSKPTESNRVFRNFDPEVHPFERAREYSRALTAVKLDKMFAKPFVRALSGHMEGVYCMAKHTERLSCIVSGSSDGELRVWNIASGLCNQSIKAAHRGFVRGVTVAPGGEHFLSCGVDGQVHVWPLKFDVVDTFDVDARPQENLSVRPIQSFAGEEAFYALDHQQRSSCFATVSSQLQIWDINRSHPLSSISWGADTHHAVRWNPAERDVLASAASDRSVTLYDARARSALRKVVLPGKSNQVCWNPRRPYLFTAANEDNNLYTFDMRHLDSALTVHHDFHSSVMSVDYSPSGREFVAGGYDMSLRIFGASSTGSRDIYHTRRMNRVFSVLFSPDANFVISGSDDSNIRVWKAQASKSLALQAPAAKAKTEYRERLKRKYGHMPQVRRIARHRHVPLPLYNAKKKKHVMLTAAKLKQKRIRLHRREGAIPDKRINEEAVLDQIE